MNDLLHPKSLVEDGACIGSGTRVWAWAHILPGAVIGSECNICDHTFIENDVVIGDRVTVKCGVFIWDGITIGDDVFIGPNVTFTNDKYPKSKQYPEKFLRTIVKKGASIGANATILPGLTIGENAMVGAGAVVTQSVPENAIVKGVPAKITGYTDTLMHSSGLVGDQERKCYAGPVLYSLTAVQDIRGDLVVGECPREIPFEPKRIFMVYNVPNSKVRGAHAHKECHQFLIASHGSINVILDDGKEREEYMLSDALTGLYIKPGVWGIQYKYSEDAVLLVLASHAYDASDYIRDYKDFLKWKEEH